MMADGLFDGGQRGANARVVSAGGAVFSKRHVEVNANENMLVFEFEIADGELGHRCHWPFAVGMVESGLSRGRRRIRFPRATWD